MAPSATPVAPGLNVVALISGGKDSFFSLLHCRANGHRVVALANLHPAAPARRQEDDGDLQTAGDHADDDQGGAAADLNSFMYQTVGHEVIPLYAEAVGLPLYRQEITGGAGKSGKDYYRSEGAGDETECMVPLLRAVVAAHPEVNAVCAGAILSTYQRTRVESVAVRLGLTPLAYLWKYPVLPLPSGTVRGDDSQLLLDMAAAGMEARIVKVASGGLDEEFLWENVASQRGVDRLLRAMRRFGGAAAGSGAVIGEGGEFETLVVDGPPELFRKRVVVDEEDRTVVREGGGTAWVKVRKAQLEEKNLDERGEYDPPRIPDLFDALFAGVLHGLEGGDDEDKQSMGSAYSGPLLPNYQSNGPSKLQQWCVVGDVQSPPSIEAETTSLVAKVKSLLTQASLAPTSIISTVIVLRDMSDFPAINKIYGSLFTQPNPPSRVTISCGDLLPPDCNIAVYLSVHNDLAPRERQGLHVQSRSYWAPANIGPYSQAISVPMSSLSSTESTSVSSSSAALVHIAGQIPLIPASMDLPGSSEPFAFSAALSLQHLWRIGADTSVQWWSSAVAYLPHAPGGAALPAKEMALLASRIWRAAHAWSTPDNQADDEAGPDLWDRRHNPAYMSFAADDADTQQGRLPDRSVLSSGVDDDLPTPVFFAAEVQELPRQAGVEWHAHVGFAHLDDGSVRVVAEESQMMQVQHTIISQAPEKGVLVHTVLAVKRIGTQTEKMPVKDVLSELQTLYLARMGFLAGSGAVDGLGGPAPTHLYVHSDVVAVSAADAGRDGCPVIPCFSLWNGRGDEVAAVAVYQEWMHRNSQ